jgi:hypothetical protein
MHNEMERVFMEAVAAYVKVLSLHLHEVLKVTTKKSLRYAVSDPRLKPGTSRPRSRCAKNETKLQWPVTELTVLILGNLRRYLSGL